MMKLLKYVFETETAFILGFAYIKATEFLLDRSIFVGFINIIFGGLAVVLILSYVWTVLSERLGNK